MGRHTQKLLIRIMLPWYGQMSCQLSRWDEKPQLSNQHTHFSYLEVRSWTHLAHSDLNSWHLVKANAPVFGHHSTDPRRHRFHCTTSLYSISLSKSYLNCAVLLICILKYFHCTQMHTSYITTTKVVGLVPADLNTTLSQRWLTKTQRRLQNRWHFISADYWPVVTGIHYTQFRSM